MREGLLFYGWNKRLDYQVTFLGWRGGDGNQVVRAADRPGIGSTGLSLCKKGKLSDASHPACYTLFLAVGLKQDGAKGEQGLLGPSTPEPLHAQNRPLSKTGTQSRWAALGSVGS